MKKLYLPLTLIFFVISQAISSQAPPEILHYMFNGTGSLVPNVATTPPAGTATGTLLGGLTQGGTGQEGGALLHTGVAASSDYLNTNWNTSLSGSWSIAFWTSSVSTSSTLFYLFGDNTAGSFRCFTNGVAGSGNWILRGTGMTDMLITGGATMTPMHNIFVYDATNTVGRMYLNGVLQGTVSQSGTAAFTGSSPFKVGGYATNIGLPSGGKLDEFRLYSRAITSCEAQQIYSIATTTAFGASSCGPYTNSLTCTTHTSSGAITSTFSAAGGTSSLTINLTINPTPTINAAVSAATVCAGALWQCTLTGASTYTWSHNLGTSATVSLFAGASSVFTVTGISSAGCIGTKTVPLTVTPGPTLNLLANTSTVCSGQPVILNVSGADTYTWSNNSNGSSIMEYPIVSTTYSVAGTNTFNNCMSSQSLSITVFPSPTIVAVSTNTAICSGNSVTVTASGASSYTWSTAGTGSSFSTTPVTTTTYYVMGSNQTCNGTTSVVVVVHPLPSIGTIPSQPSVCAGQSVAVVATGATTYSWNTGTAGATLIVSPSTSTGYTVTGFDANNCSNIKFVSVLVQASPTVNIASSSSSICLGSSVSFSATGTPSYSWSAASGSGSVITLSPAQTTTVSVTGTASNNCQASAATVVNVDACAALTEFSEAQVGVIYPNPGYGIYHFRIVNGAETSTILVYNAIGDLLISTETMDDNTLIDLRQFPAGIYYLRAQSGRREQVLKLIKE